MSSLRGIVSVLIFGLLGLPELGIAGAGHCHRAGQIVAALAVMARGLRNLREEV
jgi:Na+-driven multidrug efflux pump